ncbi:S1C family serine protease [Leptospira perolatii]|uniref:PDZ domain-containing protein n=1 Tax=Leptospira perolatii TaxID=2023191 RepID=A0ABX4PHS3_9LEPT|nr:trypsin-like peptidase domain-containing protein [Leptospira perolatii]PJZ71298.1 hypothetical protein CH360_01990 [Leptospira perolatii]
MELLIYWVLPGFWIPFGFRGPHPGLGGGMVVGKPKDPNTRLSQFLQGFLLCLRTVGAPTDLDLHWNELFIEQTSPQNRPMQKIKSLYLSFLLAFFSLQCSDKTQIENLNEESLLISLHLQSRLISLFEAQLPATASIFPKGSTETSKAIGSGFFINRRGNLLTCQHVIQGRREVIVQQGKTTKKWKAIVIKEDKELDLALLEVQIDSESVPFLAIPKIYTGKHGTIYLAIGASYGLPDSVTFGLISFPQRANVDPAKPLQGFVQLSQSVLPGMSGGPILDLEGTLIGVQRFTYTPTGLAGIGPGFAIPAGKLSAFVESDLGVLADKQKVQRGIIEIPITTPFLVNKLKLPSPFGVIVSSTEKGSPAERAGLQRYDFIVAVDEEKIRFAGDFFRIMSSKNVKEDIVLTIFRSGKEQKITVSE